MVNEEILTGLRNALENGDSLEAAVAILINSGYNPKDVKEASNYLYSSGTINIQTPKPDENLIMPNKKLPTSIKSPNKPSIPSSSSKTETQFSESSSTKNYGLPQDEHIHLYKNNEIDEIKQAIDAPKQDFSSSDYTPSPSVTKQLEGMRPKQSHTKEILLAIVLLVLVGILILTLVYKDEFLALFGA